jgi:hypothetical protein
MKRLTREEMRELENAIIKLEKEMKESPKAGQGEGMNSLKQQLDAKKEKYSTCAKMLSSAVVSRTMKDETSFDKQLADLEFLNQTHQGFARHPNESVAKGIVGIKYVYESGERAKITTDLKTQCIHYQQAYNIGPSGDGVDKRGKVVINFWNEFPKSTARYRIRYIRNAEPLPSHEQDKTKVLFHTIMAHATSAGQGFVEAG